MSSDSLLNKEKSSALNLDSDSDFDKKSLAKSIEINPLEKEEIDSNINNNKNFNEDQIKNPTCSYCNKQENTIIKEGIVSPINAQSNSKLISAVIKTDSSEDGENLLIFEKASDIKNLIKTNNLQNNNHDNKYTTDKGTNCDNNPKIEKTLLQKLEAFDIYLSLIVHDLHLGRNIDFLIYIFARLFNPDFIVSYFLVILSYKIYSDNDFYFVLKPIASTVLGLAITLFLKKHFGRTRPDYSKNSKRIFDLRRGEKNCSMPSGDSLQAANFSVILFFYFNSTFGFFVIPFVMFARVYFYCHYIFDTIVGALLGFFSSALVYHFVNLNQY